MIGPDKIKTWAFSYDEAEDICRKYYSIEEFVYGTADDIWFVDCNTDKEFEMLDGLRKEYPEIPKDAICFYRDAVQIFPRKDVDIIVIAGISK